MKIAIIGYGKMGKLIESIALERGHEIVLKIGGNNLEEFTPINIQKADIAIEFSLPETGYNNVKKCIKSGVSVISGTTGWTAKLSEIESLAYDQKIGFIYASNFSLGVNLFFALNNQLSRMMQNHSAYRPSIEEIHHTSKKDSPSGTAITLANQIISNSSYKTWKNEGKVNPDELQIQSKRIDPAPGIHTVSYDSLIDSIQIKHTAHSRNGFALGAVIAAEWMFGKKGVFTMQDVLELS